MDIEWYEVCRNGATLNGLGDQLNEEAANALAADAAENNDAPVCVVRCRRTEVRRYQRQVTVSATDTGAAAPAVVTEAETDA